MPSHYRLAFVALAGVSTLFLSGTSRADPPQYLEKTSDARAAELRSGRWIDIVQREIPPLKNAPAKNTRGGRMPMIMWHGVGFDPLQPSEITLLRDRGLCQHLQMSESMIAAAKVLQQANMPVILMEGRTDSWPYSLAEDPTSWAHQFDDSYQQPWFGKEDAKEWHGACPHKTDGWTVLARNTKQTMAKFRDAGVQVDAVLVDYEGDPYPWSHLFEQLRHCKRCRRELPPEVIANKSAWRDYSWHQYVTLYDQHFAKAIREIFPDCLVTNWHVVFSSEADPVRYFVRDVKLPTLRPRFFNATNPIAYASDLVWRELWNPSSELTQAAVDDFYDKQIVQQIASDRKNRSAAGAHGVRCIPWVARVCRMGGEDDPPVPTMSRARYRAALGELWGMEVHTMQVFNPMHEGYEELAITELQDAVAAYDEMLE